MSTSWKNVNSFEALSSNFSRLKVISCNGSDGVVLSGIDKSLSDNNLNENEAVALKRLSLVGKGHCRVALRELRLLKRFVHENIVKTIKITDSNGTTIEDPSMESFSHCDSVYVIEELLDSDLHRIIEKNGKLPLETCKLFMYQLLRGLKYIHSANVVHRDIKPGNLFVKADDLSLKVGDYGLARVFDHRYKHKGYLTALVSTRFYRAPEVMLNVGDYSYPIDIWSAGCVFGEMLQGKVMFPGENDLDQLNCIADSFCLSVDDFYTKDSTFPGHLFEGFPPEAIDLLNKMLYIDSELRITAEKALAHPFFAELHDCADEPTCSRPFYVEHEIDNLPTKILKRKILRDSSSFSEKRFSSDESLFKDFEETFIINDDVHAHISPWANSDTDTDTQSSNNSTSIDSNCDAYLTVQKKTDNPRRGFIPSFDDVFYSGDSIQDEPCRDPGLCERRYNEFPTCNWQCENKVEKTLETTQSSYFADLSPVIEMNEFNYEQRNFLEMNGRYCANEEKPKYSMKSLNSNILDRLNKNSIHQHCGLEEFLTRKKMPSISITTWDSVRFWA